MFNLFLTFTSLLCFLRAMVTSEIPMRADTQVTSNTNSDRNLTPADAFTDPSSSTLQTNVLFTSKVLLRQHIFGEYIILQCLLTYVNHYSPMQKWLHQSTFTQKHFSPDKSHLQLICDHRNLQFSQSD